MFKQRMKRKPVGFRSMQQIPEKVGQITFRANVFTQGNEKPYQFGGNVSSSLVYMYTRRLFQLNLFEYPFSRMQIFMHLLKIYDTRSNMWQVKQYKTIKKKNRHI